MWVTDVIAGQTPRACLFGGEDVLGLGAFLALGNFHRDFLTLFQGPETFHLDGAVMHEDVRATLTLDEPESFVIVEPLDGSCNSIT
jgi:hypothetical protein